MTLRQALRDATEQLRQAGIDSPEHDAKALALHVLGLKRPSDLLLHDTINQQLYDDLVSRRAARVPLQHLTGTAPFRYLELEVGPGVFVPRPETEVVVGWAVKELQSVNAPLVVDLCAGSGTCALAIANEVPGATVHAVEQDPTAWEWAERNATTRAAAGDSPIRLHLSTVVDALPELDGRVDLVISNPPYVAEDERHIPDPEVVDHDPELALFAGADGLDVIRQVEQTAKRLLKPGGLVVVEHSDRQGASAPAVFAQAGGWTDIADHQDLTGRDRFVTARLTP